MSSGTRNHPSMAEHKLLQINLREILKRRIPRGRGRFIPGFVYSALERLVCQRQLNEILRLAYPRRGSAFSKAVLEHLDLTVEVVGLDALPAGERYVFASNHPLGGLDGIALIAVLGERYGDEHLRFLVNDMLMNVEPLTDVFLPVNKYGSQGRAAAAAINDAFASTDTQIAVFPAGLVSRMDDDSVIKDLKWQKAFAAKAIEYGRKVVPVHFEALNRSRFYRIARLRKRLGIKVNLEQILLPSELCAMRSHKFRIIFGSPIDPAGQNPATLTAEARRRSYDLIGRSKSVK